MNKSTLMLVGALLATVSAAPVLAQDLGAEFDSQWGLGMIGVDVAWGLGYTGDGVLVGVTDSGLEIGADLHPEFADSFDGRYLDGFGIGMTDLNGHGTHVAGIIAAGRDGTGMVGVAYGSKIIPMRLLTGLQGDPTAKTEDVINYGIDQGVRIFNASWGYNGSHQDYAHLVNPDEDTPLTRAYRRLVSSDSVIVFATGNDRDTGHNAPGIDSALPLYVPELRPAWLAVTAVNRDAELAWYAQPCELAAEWCLAAPGGDTSVTPDGGIYSTVTGGAYDHYQGTSMAAPHVSAALAIAREVYPNARLQDLSRLTLNTAVDIGEAGIDAMYGWGLLNVANLVTTASPEAGALYAQAGWAQAQALDRTIDQVSARRRLSPDAPGTPVWFSPFGGFGGLTDANVNLSGTYGIAGMVGGIDLYHDRDWQAGLTIGTTGHGFSAGNGNSAADIAVHGGAYLAFDNSQVFADLVLGGSVFSGTTTRNTAPGLMGTVLEGQLGNGGDHVDSALWADARLGGHLDLNGSALSPYAFTRAVRQNLAGVVETGNNALVLDVAATTLNRAEIGFGFELAGASWALDGIKLTPSLDLAYGRLLGDAHFRDFTLLGSDFRAATADLGRDVFHIGGALTLTRDDNLFDARLGYQGRFQSGANAHTVSATFAMKF